MKTIIAGGRTYRFTPEDIAWLDSMRSTITEVVSGKAPGADTHGEAWAKSHGITVQPFPAKWDDLSHPDASIRVNRQTGRKYDAKAGWRRNREMAKYARGGQCILFPGGTGTQNMREEAGLAGVKVIEHPSRPDEY